MTRSAQIGATLRGVHPRWATPNRIEWLAALERIYEDNGVLIDGAAPTLQRACPSCDVCWAGAEHRRQPEVPADVGSGQNASIFWPWVGERYTRGGACLVSLNINASVPDWWSIAEEYGIAIHVQESLQAGDYTPFGSSMFWWRLLCTANAVVASGDGMRPALEPDSVEVAGDVLERVSRVQAVKCVPLENRSYPTSAMRAQCPGRFALRELEVLSPGVLVALGNDALTAVDLLQDGGVAWTEQTDHFMRGTLTMPYGDATVLWLYHPTSRGDLWERAQRDLIASLERQSLRAV